MIQLTNDVLYILSTPFCSIVIVRWFEAISFMNAHECVWRRQKQNVCWLTFYESPSRRGSLVKYNSHVSSTDFGTVADTRSVPSGTENESDLCLLWSILRFIRRDKAIRLFGKHEKLNKMLFWRRERWPQQAWECVKCVQCYWNAHRDLRNPHLRNAYHCI